jgi:putative molybdopterin biosynthesis protein
VTSGPGPPPPQLAYGRWLDTLNRAGWAGSTVGRRPRAGSGAGAQRVAVGQALGRVTVAPVTACWPSPSAACAAMDGIAVSEGTLTAAPSAGTSTADQGMQRLAAGTYQWIDTGDPMPDGADTVVLRERLRPQADGSVLVAPPDRPGRNVRTAGEDFAAGEVLIPAGRRLRPGDLAAAAAGGHVTLPVVRRAAVAVIPTGDEIRPAGSALRRGDIIDTNSVMLAARCTQLGAEPLVSAVIPDDPDALAAAVRGAAEAADLVLLIAGSSHGRDDHSHAVLSQVGGVAVAGVAVRPGHPVLLGYAKRPPAADRTGVAPVIGLPGYPLAAAVVFELFAVPLLAAIAGREPARLWVRARLGRAWASPAGVEEWVPVTLRGPHDSVLQNHGAPRNHGGAPRNHGGDGRLPLAWPSRRGAGAVSQFARADAWWPIPADRTDLAAGADIDVLPLDAPG